MPPANPLPESWPGNSIGHLNQSKQSTPSNGEAAPPEELSRWMAVYFKGGGGCREERNLPSHRPTHRGTAGRGTSLRVFQQGVPGLQAMAFSEGTTGRCSASQPFIPCLTL